MEKFKNLSDAELIKALREYGIQHGPIVGSTRTLYEKKLVEVERKKKTYPSSAESSYESRQQYSSKEYDDNQDDYETYEEETYTKTYQLPQAHQRVVREDLRNNSRIGENAYQNISQVRHQSSYSQGVEARRPIRPKAMEEEPKQPARRFLPLWLQILLLLLFTGFLVYLYIQETDQNPFKFLEGSLNPSESDAHSAD